MRPGTHGEAVSFPARVAASHFFPKSNVGTGSASGYRSVI
jgi:hypothetical protein